MFLSSVYSMGMRRKSPFVRRRRKKNKLKSASLHLISSAFLDFEKSVARDEKKRRTEKIHLNESLRAKTFRIPFWPSEQSRCKPIATNPFGLLVQYVIAVNILRQNPCIKEHSASRRCSNGKSICSPCAFIYIPIAHSSTHTNRRRYSATKYSTRFVYIHIIQCVPLCLCARKCVCVHVWWMKGTVYFIRM